MAAGVEDKVAFGTRCRGQAVGETERGRESRAPRVDVDQLDLGAGNLRAQPRDQAADHAGADHRDAVAHAGRAVPARVDGGFHVGGEHRARGRQAGRQRDDGAGGDDVARLVRVQAEHRATLQRSRFRANAVLDHADADVAVFHRPGEVALLEGRAHALVFALGHLAAKDQALGAAADAAVEAAHEHLARGGRAQRGRAQFAVAGTHGPEGEAGVGHPVLPWSDACACACCDRRVPLAGRLLGCVGVREFVPGSASARTWREPFHP